MASLRRRSALHDRRAFHHELARAPAPPVVLPLGDTTLTLPAAHTVPAGKDKNNPATSTSAVIASILSGVLSPTVSTTSKSISSTTSTSSVSSTTSSSVSSTSSTLPAAKAITPTITSSTPHVVVQTATKASSSSTVLPSQTPSQSAQPSSGVSAVTLIGGIGGALLGTILLTVVIGFFLRRWRRNKSGDNAFEGDFRRSAVLLDEKDDNTPDHPRPPSMIERRNAASPPAAYPSDDPPLSAFDHGQSFAQYGANQSQYGGIPLHPSYAVGTQFGGNGGAPAMNYGTGPYTSNYGDTFSATYSGPSGENPAYGAPPVPGIHGPGAYAPYGVDTRYPQSQRPQPNQYQNQQHQHQQRGFNQGSAVDTPTSPTREDYAANVENPFSPLPLRVSKKSGSTENSGPEPGSTPALPSSTPPPSTNPGVTSPFVTRQSHDAPPTYTNNGGYADVQRDVKMSPTTSLNVVNGSSDTVLPTTTTAAPATTATATTVTNSSNGSVVEPPRPLTVYGDDDVYGGM